MAEDKKTQLGQTPGRTHRPTGGQTPVAASATPAASKSYIPQSDDPLLGTTLADRYLISKKLGEGGMGAVYLATHTILEKQVALKVLHGEFARKPDLVERFMQEAKAASRIRHENVIDISDFGATPDGYVFFAMELLQGHDLHEEIARARIAGQLLPWSRSKKIFLQICSALSAAHAKAIVHRDLKPENVFLVDFLDDHDFVKLLDFGIAKLTETADEGGGRKLTKTGMLFGTPEYMSPEQARGEQVDHRVDVYAMGCILFQLVTNRVPFEAENFMGVLSMHLTEAPPAIAPEVFDQIGAPRALAEVIDKALVKDRNVRWQTMDELANAVREVCGDPLPSDRSSRNRAPSVQSPVTTTTPRRAVPVERSPEPTGRIKTKWTGNLTVPETDIEPPTQRRSKLPLIIGAAVVVVAGGVVVAFVATRGGVHDTTPTTTGTAGSAVAIGAATSAGSAEITAPPPPPEPKVPDMVTINLDTTPHGATVTDLSTGKPYPKTTPLKFTLPGARATRQFVFHLHGFSDSIVELPLDRETITYVEPLQKGSSAGKPVIHTVPDPTPATRPGDTTATTGSGATKPDIVVVKPDTGAGSAAVPVVKPDTGDTGSAAAKPDKPCPDDEMPCLKGFGSAK